MPVVSPVIKAHTISAHTTANTLIIMAVYTGMDPRFVKWINGSFPLLFTLVHSFLTKTCHEKTNLIFCYFSGINDIADLSIAKHHDLV